MMMVDLNERFDDIEVSADLGSVRLYLTDTDYNEYNSEELLDLINEKSEKISELCIQRDYLEAENKHFREKNDNQTKLIKEYGDILNHIVHEITWQVGYGCEAFGVHCVINKEMHDRIKEVVRR